MAGNLLRCWIPSQFIIQLCGHFINISCVFSYTSWNPILLSGHINDHSLDALGDIGLKFYIFFRIKFVQGAHDHKNTLVDNVLYLGKAHIHISHLDGNAPDNIHITHYQFLLQRQPAGFLIFC